MNSINKLTKAQVNAFDGGHDSTWVTSRLMASQTCCRPVPQRSLPLIQNTVVVKPVAVELKYVLVVKYVDNQHISSI
jgi:hypothetical protein